MRKPPLPYWLIAGLSYVWPNDPQTGLPVTTVVARLPSALAALGTVLLLWKLASAMFGRRTGRVVAVLGGSSLCFLLYAPNATVEMLLTFCCVWAHAHFWLAMRYPVRSGGARLTEPWHTGRRREYRREERGERRQEDVQAGMPAPQEGEMLRCAQHDVQAGMPASQGGEKHGSQSRGTHHGDTRGGASRWRTVHLFFFYVAMGAG